MVQDISEIDYVNVAREVSKLYRAIDQMDFFLLNERRSHKCTVLTAAIVSGCIRYKSHKPLI